MGTLGHASWSPAGLDLGDQLAGRADEIEQRLTRFSGNSEISRLTERWHAVSQDTAAVLRAADLLSVRTNGWFSPLLGAQVKAWEQLATGFLDSVPQPSKACGRIEVDAGRARLVDASPGSVDLGAIAKGYAADQLRDLAVVQGAGDVLISLGGSPIALAGAPAIIGLSSPWQGWDSFGTLDLVSGALSVSADPGTRIRRGRQRSHLLDPTTGSPAMTDLCAAIVCGADAMVCEAFSSAYLAMGLDAALLLDQTQPEIDTIFMTVDGRVLASPRLSIKANPGVQDWLRGQRRQAGAAVGAT